MTTIVKHAAAVDDNYNGNTITLDTSSVVLGDYMVFCAIKYNDTFSTPAGWTLYGGTRPACGIGEAEFYVKVATGNAPSEAFVPTGVGPLAYAYIIVRAGAPTIAVSNSDVASHQGIPNLANYATGDLLIAIGVSQRDTGGVAGPVSVQPTGFTAVDDAPCPSINIIGPNAFCSKLDAASPGVISGLTLQRNQTVKWRTLLLNFAGIPSGGAPQPGQVSPAAYGYTY
jgi:hypothetical protein